MCAVEQPTRRIVIRALNYVGLEGKIFARASSQLVCDVTDRHNDHPMSAGPILSLRGITKAFPGVIANDHVDLDVYRGEVHAVVGENGAGKSTLMKIVYGFYRADAGEILVDDRPARIRSPHDAR